MLSAGFTALKQDLCWLLGYNGQERVDDYLQQSIRLDQPQYPRRQPLSSY